ncbi:hypothetical protein ACIBQ0_09565 [Nocardia nova]|uniref:hypothetical protein n=1 Tax=Nocardia nova TaxID=37330 RepID=UPI00379A4EED
MADKIEIPTTTRAPNIETLPTVVRRLRETSKRCPVTVFTAATFAGDQNEDIEVLR